MQIRTMVAISLLAVPAVLRAQSSSTDTLFARSPWAAEAAVGGGSTVSLLHVAPGGGAWVLSLAGNVQHLRSSVDAFGQTQTQTASGGQVALAIGRRQYRGVSALRPFVGAGVMGTYGGIGNAHTWGGGAYGELGAAYFVVPHVSVGVADMLRFNFTRQSFSGGAQQQLDTSMLALAAPTVRVTVFF